MPADDTGITLTYANLEKGDSDCNQADLNFEYGVIEFAGRDIEFEERDNSFPVTFGG